MELAQKFYDSIGNEIFENKIAELKANPSNKVIKLNELTMCIFPDGSSIMFGGGFAYVGKEVK